MLHIEIDDMGISDDTGDDREAYCRELAKAVVSVASRIVVLTEKPLPSVARKETLYNIHGDCVGEWWLT